MAYAYDVNGNQITETACKLNLETNQMENNYKYDYSYDLAYGIDDLLLPESDYFGWTVIHKPIYYTYFEYVENEWVADEKETFYYSPVGASSISELSEQNFRIYPNPVSDVINFHFTSDIQMTTFELYNAQGSKLISKQVNNNESLSLDGLSSGIYFYQIEIDGVRQNGKLLKK